MYLVRVLCARRTVAVSSVSVVAMLLLLGSEFMFYRTTRTETHLAVDTSSEDATVVVDTHITFFDTRCSELVVNFHDHKGKEVDDASIVATRLPWVGDETGRAVKDLDEKDSNGCSIATAITVPKVCLHDTPFQCMCRGYCIH